MHVSKARVGMATVRKNTAFDSDTHSARLGGRVHAARRGCVRTCRHLEIAPLQGAWRCSFIGGRFPCAFLERAGQPTSLGLLPFKSLACPASILRDAFGRCDWGRRFAFYGGSAVFRVRMWWRRDRRCSAADGGTLQWSAWKRRTHIIRVRNRTGNRPAVGVRHRRRPPLRLVRTIRRAAAGAPDTPPRSRSRRAPRIARRRERPPFAPRRRRRRARTVRAATGFSARSTVAAEAASF